VKEYRFALKWITNYRRDFTSVNYKGKFINRRIFFLSMTIFLYLKKIGLYDYKEIYEFCDYFHINANQKISKLPDGMMNLVYLMALIKTETSIIIGTAGMHGGALTYTYRLLNQFLGKGGHCIELTYPPIQDQELDAIIGVKVKSIDGSRLFIE
jgi:hypothetical protein